jgi:hypothetical protein
MKLLACAVVLLTASSASAEMAPMYHNGSRFVITKDNGIVEIRYETPRKGLPVKEGQIVFSGTVASRGTYRGTAYTFKRGCEPAPYAVTGIDADPGIIFTGLAPQRDPNGCAVIGSSANKHSRLVFEYEPGNPE